MKKKCYTMEKGYTLESNCPILYFPNLAKQSNNCFEKYLFYETKQSEKKGRNNKLTGKILRIN